MSLFISPKARVIFEKREKSRWTFIFSLKTRKAVFCSMLGFKDQATHRGHRISLFPEES